MDSAISTQVAIIGAGPTGIEMAVALKKQAIPFLIFDAGQIGHTISWWPRNTRFFSTSERIAMPGMPFHVFDQQHPTGEQYLAYLRGVVEQFDLTINSYEQVDQIVKVNQGYQLQTTSLKGEHYYLAQQVILATGGMSQARRLQIPGEDLPHVSHYLNDPHQYFQKDLLVIGGRNSAVEYALRCWRAGARVTLSYRREEINRQSVKPALLQDLDTVIREEQLKFVPSSVPVRITPQEVVLEKTDQNGKATGQRIETLHPDFVLVCIGYTADMSLFAQLGVTLQGELQIPVYGPETMQTNVPDVYVLGTAAGGTQQKYTHFIETSHAHVPKILKSIQAGMRK